MGSESSDVAFRLHPHLAHLSMNDLSSSFSSSYLSLSARCSFMPLTFHILKFSSFFFISAGIFLIVPNCTLTVLLFTNSSVEHTSHGRSQRTLLHIATVLILLHDHSVAHDYIYYTQPHRLSDSIAIVPG